MCRWVRAVGLKEPSAEWHDLCLVGGMLGLSPSRGALAPALLLFACGCDAPAASDGGAGGAGATSSSPIGSQTGSQTGSQSTTTSGGGLIDGPLGECVFHDVPGAICANGTPTGLGVNQGAGDRIVVFLSPGSACLDEGCNIGTPSMRKDGGFRDAELAACVAGDCDGGVTFPSASIFDRASAANPFPDATYVFVSVCSGDYYIGESEHAFDGWTATFHGHANQALFAKALADSFPGASRVVLTGGSAGSVGAMLNYWQWVDAFPGKRVDLVSDSFALVDFDGPEFRYALHAPVLPPGCATCAADYRTVYDFNASIAGSGRIAVVDSENNWTLDAVSGFTYTQDLEALQPRLDALPNTRYFIANGNVHVLLREPLDSDATDVEQPGGNALLGAFLAAMQSDGGTWTSETCLSP